MVLALKGLTMQAEGNRWRKQTKGKDICEVRLIYGLFIEAAHCPVKPELSFSSRKFSPGLHFPAPSMSIWYHVTSCPCALVLASGMWENMWSWPICNSPFWMGDFFIVLPWPSSEALSQGWPVCFLNSGLTPHPSCFPCWALTLPVHNTHALIAPGPCIRQLGIVPEPS